MDETIDTWRSYFRNSLSDTYADEAELETHTEQMLADYMKETGYSEQYLIASFEDDMALQKPLRGPHRGDRPHRRAGAGRLQLTGRRPGRLPPTWPPMSAT